MTFPSTCPCLWSLWESFFAQLCQELKWKILPIRNWKNSKRIQKKLTSFQFCSGGLSGSHCSQLRCSYLRGWESTRKYCTNATGSTLAKLFFILWVIFDITRNYITKETSFQHLLPLPAFFLLFNNIWDHIIISNASTPVPVPLLPGVQLPVMWLYLLGNVVTQYVCIGQVYVLTTECSSLTVTLVVTLRKFISLLFSIVYFKNPFTIYHWVGTTLVFIGTIIFTEIVQRIKGGLVSSFSVDSKSKKKIK